MSLNRLNKLLMYDIIPFNYGMDYASCLKFYDEFHDTMSELCTTDPRSWSKDTVDMVNRRAKEQNELVNKLMAMPEDEFHDEVERIEKIKKES
jgi:hypothetical protein